MCKHIKSNDDNDDKSKIMCSNVQKSRAKRGERDTLF